MGAGGRKGLPYDESQSISRNGGRGKPLPYGFPEMTLELGRGAPWVSRRGIRIRPAGGPGVPPLRSEGNLYGGRVRTPAPTAEFFGGERRAHNVRPYRRGGGNLAPYPPQCAHWGTCPYPLCPFGTSSLPLLAFGHFPLTGGIGPLTRGVGPQGGGLGKTKRDRFWTCPLNRRGEAELRTKFLCLLSFSKKGGDPAPPRRVRFLI